MLGFGIGLCRNDTLDPWAGGAWKIDLCGAARAMSEQFERWNSERRRKGRVVNTRREVGAGVLRHGEEERVEWISGLKGSRVRISDGWRRDE